MKHLHLSKTWEQLLKIVPEHTCHDDASGTPGRELVFRELDTDWCLQHQELVTINYPSLIGLNNNSEKEE